MNPLSSRIPDDMADEVLAEAARLFTEANTGYSLGDLEQAGLEAQIPAHIIRQAIKNVEEKRSRQLIQRQQQQEYIKQQVRKGISYGIALLIPAIAVSGIFIFREHLKPVVSGVILRFNLSLQFKTLTVNEGKLEYLSDPKGLSIAIADASSYSGARGIIGTDGYESMPINGNVGSVYEYKGTYNYTIKITEVSNGNIFGSGYAKFQIEQQGQQPQSAVQRLEENVVQPLTEEVKQLRQEREKLTSQLEELQKEGYGMKQQLQWQDKEVKRLEKENREYRVKCVRCLEQ